MSNLGPGEDKYQDPNQLSTADLREILRLDLDAFDEGADSDCPDYIFRVMEVLDQRESASEPASEAKIEEAWSCFLAKNPSFTAEQSPAEENAISLTNPSERILQHKKPARRMPFLRILIATMLTIALLGSVTASAFNINIFTIIGHWTQSFFQLGVAQDDRVVEGHNTGPQAPCEDLENALREAGITEAILPTWFPPDFVSSQTDKQLLPDRTIFFSSLNTADKLNIAITITQYAKLPENLVNDYEKNDGSVENYEVAGITHYILFNYDKTAISWLTKSFEISITGDFTKKEAHKIIDSIYEES